jgi:hypothetical protein
VTNLTPRSPLDLLGSLVHSLCFALEAQTQSPTRRLARPLMSLILHRLLAISHRLRRFIARIEAGRPFPRPRGAPARPAKPPKYTPDPLPRRHDWLAAVLPELAPHRGNLASLLATPEMAALMAAAPAQMGRALRPLCRMLGVRPPPVLALPPRPKPARPKKPPAPPQAKWPHDPRRRTRLGFYIGPPPPLACIAAYFGPGRRKISD